MSREYFLCVLILKHRLDSLAEVGQLFSERFPVRAPVNNVTIWYNIQKYTCHGTSLNRHEKNSGRKRTGCSPKNIDAVQEALRLDPSGLKCRANTLGVPPSFASQNRLILLFQNFTSYRHNMLFLCFHGLFCVEI